MENQQGEQGALTPDELSQFSSKIEKGEQFSDEEAVKALKALPHLKKTIDGLYSRTKTAEEDAKTLKEKLSQAGATPLSSSPQAPQTINPEMIEQKMDLRADGYSREEVDYIEKFAKSAGKSLIDAAQDPFIQAGIQGMRSIKKAETVTPPPSQRASVLVGTKTWEQMTPHERQQNIDSAWNAKLQGGKRSTE